MERFFSLLSLLAFLLSAFPAWAQFAGGSGTANDPYLVADAIQLSSVRYYPTCHYLQIADIDLNVYPYNQGIGWQSMTFSGVYDGGNYQIANMMINRPGGSYYNGLFNGALELKNINLNDYSITGGSVIGGLAASLSNAAVTNCSVSGTISGDPDINAIAGGLLGMASGSVNLSNCQANVNIVNTYKTGGLVGDFLSDTAVSSLINCSVSGSVTGNPAAGLCISISNGQITQCSTTCQVSSNGHAGGLLVNVDNAIVSNCHTTGSVSCLGAEGMAGGLITFSSDSQITGCYASGHVQGSEASGSYSGGLVAACGASGTGQLSMLINRCYATGNVVGYTAGGLIGNLSPSYGTATVSNCYARGNVEGESNTGGFIGEVLTFGQPNEMAYLQNCYCTGDATSAMPWGSGGFGGWYYGEATLTGCYWNTDNTANTNDFYDLDLPGVIGVTTVQMKYPQSVSTFAAWDFQDIWTHDTDHTHNNGYPYLETEAPGTVAAVGFNPPGGSYNQPFYLTMACPTTYSHIYYTLDGSEPSESSMEFVAEIVVAHNTTVKARAYRNGWEPSEICTAIYTFPSTAEDELLPSSNLCLAAYPNPFSKQLSLECTLPKSSDARLQIYNLKGQLVRELNWKNLSSGLQSFQWDGIFDNGKRASSGMYLCKLKAAEQSAMCKVLLIK